MKKQIKIMFMCLGNIIRSPLLHYLLEKRLEEEGLQGKIVVDSCALTSFHVGKDMDPRMRHLAEREGHPLPKHKAKLFKPEMLKECDYLFVVTKEILEVVQETATKEEVKKILLATHFSPEYLDKDIGDPYYGGSDYFLKIFRMVDAVVDDLVIEFKKRIA
jgi:protein-tyrosine phosphatase